MSKRKRLEYLIITSCVLLSGFVIYGFVGSIQPLINDSKVASFFAFGVGKMGGHRDVDDRALCASLDWRMPASHQMSAMGAFTGRDDDRDGNAVDRGASTACPELCIGA